MVRQPWRDCKTASQYWLDIFLAGNEFSRSQIERPAHKKTYID